MIPSDLSDFPLACLGNTVRHCQACQGCPEKTWFSYHSFSWFLYRPWAWKNVEFNKPWFYEVYRFQTMIFHGLWTSQKKDFPQTMIKCGCKTMKKWGILKPWKTVVFKPCFFMEMINKKHKCWLKLAHANSEKIHSSKPEYPLFHWIIVFTGKLLPSPRKFIFTH
jgi:hypothetical protein